MRFRFFCTALVLLPMVSHAGHWALTSFGDGFKVKRGTEITLKHNLPPTFSQDSFGICYSHGVSWMMTYENCVAEKKDCSKIGADEIFSPLDVGRYGNVAEGAKKDPKSYRGIKEGGPGLFTLENAAIYTGEAASQKCASLDKLLVKLGGAGGDPTDAQEGAYDKLKEAYDKFKGLQPDCDECIKNFMTTFRNDIGEKFEVKGDNTELLKVFSEDTYEKFFDRFAVPEECKNKENRVQFKNKENSEAAFFPKTGDKKDFKSTLKKIQSVLKKDHPILLDNICLDEEPTENCSDVHVAVITGYRRICDVESCYDALRIQNSWGKTWQDDHDGGWVEARRLLDSTFYPNGTLSWVEPKSKTKKKKAK